MRGANTGEVVVRTLTTDDAQRRVRTDWACGKWVDSDLT